MGDKIRELLVCAENGSKQALDRGAYLLGRILQDDGSHFLQTVIDVDLADKSPELFLQTVSGIIVSGHIAEQEATAIQAVYDTIKGMQERRVQSTETHKIPDILRGLERAGAQERVGPPVARNEGGTSQTFFGVSALRSAMDIRSDRFPERPQADQSSNDLS